MKGFKSARLYAALSFFTAIPALAANDWPPHLSVLKDESLLQMGIGEREWGCEILRQQGQVNNWCARYMETTDYGDLLRAKREYQNKEVQCRTVSDGHVGAYTMAKGTFLCLTPTQWKIFDRAAERAAAEQARQERLRKEQNDRESKDMNPSIETDASGNL